MRLNALQKIADMAMKHLWLAYIGEMIGFLASFDSAGALECLEIFDGFLTKLRVMCGWRWSWPPICIMGLVICLWKGATCSG
jgi:hypothetical protein